MLEGEPTTTRRPQRHASGLAARDDRLGVWPSGGCRPRRNTGTPRQWVYSMLTVLGLSLLLLLSAQAQEDTRGALLSRPQRVALVIGNSQYATAPLSNPVNDATDMAEVLGKVGFAVTLLKNGDQAQIETAVTMFVQQLSRDSVGLFYFGAGNGREATAPGLERQRQGVSLCREASAVSHWDAGGGRGVSATATLGTVQDAAQQRGHGICAHSIGDLPDGE